MTRLESWSQAQQGSVAAIANLLTTALDNLGVKVEVSRRDRTLYVFLTAGTTPLPEGSPAEVYGLIKTLAPADITHLKVLDGTNRRLVDRWQHDFDLQAPSPPEVLAPVAPLPSPLQAIEPAAPAPDRRPQPVGGPRRWAALPLVVSLAFGLAAGVTHWRYDQRGADAPATPATAGLALPPLPAPPPAEAQAVPLDPEPPAPEPPVALTIKAVGDIIPGTDYQRYRLPDDWQYLFRSIQYHLGEADITFGNFESTLTEVPHSAKDTRSANTFAFRTPPWYASVLKEAGFDVLSVANNHSMDFFEQGFADTIAHIEAAGMKAVGRKDTILYVEAGGQTVAFIAFSNYAEHNRVQDVEGAIALVQTASAQADIVVVSFHAGKEGTGATVTRDQDELFFSENRGNVVRFSRAVIDHGADLVLGHGPHVPRALELYNNKLIAYSLGNFLGYRSLSTVGPLGTSLILQTDLDAQGNFVGGRIIPVALDNNGVPYLDDHFGGVVLVRQFTQRDFPDTPLEIDDLGYVRRR
ncbi:MAG TPA: CapA family protein [Nodosilinea sp.]|nr:CapA family protein [Nodosilinea sp.]